MHFTLPAAQVEALQKQKCPDPKSSESKSLMEQLKSSHKHAVADLAVNVD